VSTSVSWKRFWFSFFSNLAFDQCAGPSDPAAGMVAETEDGLVGLVRQTDKAGRARAETLQMAVKSSRRHLGAGAWHLRIAVSCAGEIYWRDFYARSRTNNGQSGASRPEDWPIPKSAALEFWQAWGLLITRGIIFVVMGRWNR
jgi:hypothetical protein